MTNDQALGTPGDDGRQPAHDFILGQLADTAGHLRDVAEAALVEPDDYVIITGFLDHNGTGCLMLQEVSGRDRMLALQALKTWVDTRIAEATN